MIHSVSVHMRSDDRIVALEHGEHHWISIESEVIIHIPDREVAERLIAAVRQLADSFPAPEQQGTEETELGERIDSSGYMDDVEDPF